MQSLQDETLTYVFLTHFVSIFLKENYPKNISDVPSKILEKKEHNYQTNLVPRVEENPGNEVVIRLEFVIFLKLGFLW